MTARYARYVTKTDHVKRSCEAIWTKNVQRTFGQSSESVEKSGGQKWLVGHQEFSASASGVSSNLEIFRDRLLSYLSHVSLTEAGFRRYKNPR